MATARSERTGGGEREFWTLLARGWERWEPVLLHSLAGVDPVLLRALDLRPGHRVVDLGCGSGEPALAIARWVGPRGRVLGVDIVPGMLGVARRRARMLGLRNVRFRRCDLARLPPGGAGFDRAVSRFGLMFADDVPLALRRIHRSLRRGGRFAAAVWGPSEKNPGHAVRAAASRPFLDEPPPDPEASPHPLRLARPGLLPRLMRQAGFRAVRAEAVPVIFAYASADEYARMQTETALAPLYRALSARDRRRLHDRLRRGIGRFRDGRLVRVPGLAWVVSGRR